MTSNENKTSPSSTGGSERLFPSLYDELIEVSYMAILVSGLAELRRLARAGLTTNNAILTLPFTGTQLKEFFSANKKQIHGKMRMKDYAAIESMLEGTRSEDKSLETIMSQGALHYMGDDKAHEECVYSINTNLLRKRIVVTFRGSITVQDWIQDTKAIMVDLPNPLSGQESQSDTVGVHAGFLEYLYHKAPSTTDRSMMDRQAESSDGAPPDITSSETDVAALETVVSPEEGKAATSILPLSLNQTNKVTTGTWTNRTKGGESDAEKEPSKLDLIMGQVQSLLDITEYEDFTVYVTGHSLGGSLSLLFAMEAAIKLRTPHPVTVFAMGNPRTGNLDFRHVICSLEEQHKLRCLCVHNLGDLVPFLPAGLLTTLCVWRRGLFRHVGIKMTISEIDMSIRYRSCAEESFWNNFIRQDYYIRGNLRSSLSNPCLCCSPSTSVSVARHLFHEYVSRLEELKSKLKPIYLDDIYDKSYAPGASP
mmetsp:Transcript_14718/g.24348  ORF Transcript_14718/g.24348 Transcript_14718/m.24348 type:complete len:480 (-) Transcript_14718:334-1773(-)|eukprot:CAMPEP_0119019524 /NCGR_PEP_ID=MMETSP1176-20130426/22051_1 /TAXON_ID=265551 /ORGANISM="Synedropsis recta cf, Strain CCMP1620" /LENGTH=479 /DNA_ID=CAMNT_0006973737 /DNA_START=59 /DNA_END=1498 /DNA_ORIENTATION=+